MRPNAHLRDQRAQERRIRSLSESTAARAVTTVSSEAVIAAGAVDESGDFQRYGRLNLDPLAIFRLGA